MSTYETHSFYCINCGHKGIPLPRKSSYKYKKSHRKRMYCPFCRHTVNHIECQNSEEVNIFMQQFLNGDFKAEAEEELEYESEHPNFAEILLMRMDRK